MSPDRRCTEICDALDDALFARRTPAAELSAHARDCVACTEHLEALRETLARLDEAPAAQLSDASAGAIRRHVAQQLASEHAAQTVAARDRSLPEGYARELARILAWAMLPLPLVMFIYAQLFQLGGALLGQWLPQAVVLAIGAAAALGASSWMAFVYGSIPFVAHRRALAARPVIR
jgi:hypothetical protein